MDIFNGYMDEDERALAIYEAKNELEMSNLFAMLEMVNIHHQQNVKAIEYKVFSEGGTYSDYEYLLEQEQQQVQQQSGNIFDKIFDTIKSIFTTIGNFFQRIFSSKALDGQQQYDVDQDTHNALEAMKNKANDVGTFIDAATNGRFTEALNIAKRSLPFLLGAGVVGGIGFGVAKVVENGVGNTINNVKEWANNIKQAFGSGNTMSEKVKNALEAIKGKKPQDPNSEEGKAFSQVQKALNTLAQNIQSVATRVGTKVASVGQEIKNFFTGGDNNQNQLNDQNMPANHVVNANSGNPTHGVNGIKPGTNMNNITPEQWAANTESTDDEESNKQLSIFGVDFVNEMVTDEDTDEVKELSNEFKTLFA